jgi:hypothetical protein
VPTTIGGLSGGTIINNPLGQIGPQEGGCFTLSTLPLGDPGDGSFFAGGGTLVNLPTSATFVPHNLAKLAAGQGLRYFDAPTGYTEQHAQGQGGKATRVMVGPWSQYPEFYSYMLGYSINVADPNNPGHGKLLRSIPAQHPKDPSKFVEAVELVRGDGAAVFDPFVVAVGANGQPLLSNITLPDGVTPLFPGPGRQVPLPFVFYANKRPGGLGDGAAVCAVHYATRDFIVKDDLQAATDPMGEAGRWVQWRRENALQAIQVPPTLAQQLKFVSDGQMIPQTNPTLLQPTAQISAEWFDVPDLNHDLFRACEGHVNPDVFPPAFHPLVGNPRPPETLLCLPVQYTSYRVPTGFWAHKVKFSFFERPQGWNSFLRVQGSNIVYDRATFGGAANGATLYKFPDNGIRFIDLFTMPLPQPYEDPHAY